MSYFVIVLSWDRGIAVSWDLVMWSFWFDADFQWCMTLCWKFVVFLFEKLLLFHKKSLTLQVVSLCSRRYVGWGENM